jgi:hypothetical protein
MESNRVFVALIENYSTSKPLNVSPGKSQILSCDTVVADERYADWGLLDVIYISDMLLISLFQMFGMKMVILCQ